ncbi:hypothetical protein H4582DRAFT_2063722 [Lactarius indigo]|nr:hypothetical protein H4582DRAFT_2063722 [Lactarius indigo]
MGRAFFQQLPPGGVLFAGPREGVAGGAGVPSFGKAAMVKGGGVLLGSEGGYGLLAGASQGPCLMAPAGIASVMMAGVGGISAAGTDAVCSVLSASANVLWASAVAAAGLLEAAILAAVVDLVVAWGGSA